MSLFTPQIAIADNGEAVIAWGSGGGGPKARRFNSSSPSLGPIMVLDLPGEQQDMAIDSQGDFVMLTGYDDCYVQCVTSSGIPLGDRILVNTFTNGFQGPNDIAMDAEGNFVVSWQDHEGLDGSDQGVFAQAFSSAGARLGGNFQVNTYTTDNQSHSSLAMNASGDMVFAWDSYHVANPFNWYDPLGQDGSGAGVYAQRYRRGVPQVQSTQVNDGSAQRSRVTDLSVTFDTRVNFAGAVADAFTLVRNGGNPVSFTASASIVDGRTVVTLSNFTGVSSQFGSLVDGRYTLTVLASQVTDNYGQHLDGDGDLQQGGNFTFSDAQGLFRFFGDVNGDRHVDIADFGLFSSTFNLHAGQTGFIAAFDFNGDGVIDIADFGQFSVRLFTPLP
jgi:Dockerin type I domain